MEQALKRPLIFLLVMWSIADARAQDYPQWRGPRRDGSASDFREPKTWPEKLTKRWTVEVGEGYAAPIVAGNRVYVFTRQGDNEALTALDTTTGKTAWQSKYPALHKVGDPAKAHGSGPKSTPLFFEGNIYTMGISGTVSAFDAANGKPVWQSPVKGEAPFFGAASSPLGDGELIILHPGNYEPLTAFHAAKGKMMWQSKGGGEYVSPIIAELDGVRQVVTMTQENLVGVSLTNGSILWSYPWPSEGGGMHAITPIIYRGAVIASSYHCGVSAIKPVLRQGRWSADAAWHTEEVSMFLSNPVLIGDVLFGLSERASGQYFALDARTGKALWLGKPREAANTAIVKAGVKEGDLLFLLNDDGEMTIAKTHSGAIEPVGKYHVADSATWAQPAISGNRIFVKDLKSITLWTID